MSCPSDPYDWANCQAATLSHLCGLKSTPKSAARRQLNITTGMIATAAYFISTVDDERYQEQLDEVKARVARAVEWGRERGLCRD